MRTYDSPVLEFRESGGTCTARTSHCGIDAAAVTTGARDHETCLALFAKLFEGRMLIVFEK